MILFKCACGSAYRLDDKYAGGTAECESCGERIGIPTESDPDVLLVFKAGEDKEGLPMTRADVLQLIEKEGLQGTDLVLDEGLWRPFNVELLQADTQQIKTIARKEDPFTKALKVRSPSEGEDEPEEVEIVDLPKIDLEEGLEPEEAPVLPGMAQQAGAAPVKKSKARRFVTMIVCLGVIGYTYWAFLGPPVLAALKITSKLYMVNGSDKACNVVVPGLQMPVSVAPKSVVPVEAVVPGPKMVTVTTTGEAEPQNQVYRVLMWPRAAKLVNIGGVAKLKIIDREAVREESLGEPLKSLAEQVRDRKLATALTPLFERLKEISGKSAEGAPEGDVLNVGSALVLDLQGNNSFGGDESARRVITAGPANKIHFADGHVTVRKDGRLTGVLNFEALKLEHDPDLSVVIRAGQTLTLEEQSNRLFLHGIVPSQEITAQDHTFPGVWEYKAWVPVQGHSDPKPFWEWKFTGNKTDNGSELTVTATLNSNKRKQIQVRKDGKPLGGGAARGGGGKKGGKGK